MVCRNCKKEIPDDSVLCPRCGAKQTLHSKRREAPVSKRHVPRGTVLSLLFMGVVIAVAVVVIPIFKTTQYETRLKEIRDAVAVLDTQDKMAVISVRGAIENFFRDYPGSAGAAELKALLDDAMDWHYDTQEELPTEPDESAQREHLKAIVKDKVITLRELSFAPFELNGSVTVTVSWRNMSDKALSAVYFCVRAYNTRDEIILSRDTGKQETILTTSRKLYNPSADSDEDYRSVFFDVWFSTELARIEITRIFLNYQNGDILDLDEELAAIALDS